MNKINCEKAIMAIIAKLDGEETGYSPEHLASHLADCDACRQEIEQMQNTVNLLKKQKRREVSANLWASIEQRLEAKTKTTPEMKWQYFLLLGIFLVACKLLEMLPETDFGFFFKFTPIVFVAVLFILLKENPFKIKTELTLEREKI
jgi:predicted anti-sigma-YlaC factor YlaD